MAYTRKQFIERVAPLAKVDAKNSKVLASLTIAQAILESNNGNSTLTVQGNALFGIKASTNWKGKVWTGSTIEYYDGKNATTITAGFRAYESWQESINDHSKLLTGASRYKAVIGEKDYKKACKAVHQAGYATDPQYATKLIQLIETNNLQTYDEAVTAVVDQDLLDAVSKIIKSGIKIDLNSWKRLDLIKLKNVPVLISKLGGLDGIEEKLRVKAMTIDLVKWRKGVYTESNVRSLLIKYAQCL